MPRLGRPTGRATWSDLKGTLPGGGVDRLTGTVGRGFTCQLVVAPLSKDCWEFRHNAEVLDGFRRRMCKALSSDGALECLQPRRPSIFILFPFDDVKGPQ
jgi:hypothetical protein